MQSATAKNIFIIMKSREKSGAKKEGGTIFSKYSEKLKGIGLTILQIIVLVWIFETFGAYGVLGYMGIWFLFGLWRLWVFRDNFMTSLRYIESVFFGKSLDRKQWDKGEFKELRKKRKIKFVWRKKDNARKR